jgi:hypothetical protein
VTEQGTSESEQPIGQPVGSEARTVEQVEAEYRARQAGKDRENQALRDDLARYQAAEQQRTAQVEAQRTAELGEAETLRRQLAEERAARVIDTRRARFPNAADALDEEFIESLNR